MTQLDIAGRLAALRKGPMDLLRECERTAESTEEVLLRWQQEALSPNAHLELANAWCQLRAPGLVAVRRLSTQPPLWELEGARGTARVTSTQLSEWRYCKVKISDATGQAPQLRGKWSNVWRALMNAATDVDVGELGTETGLVRDWIASYLGWHDISPDLASVGTERRAFWEEDCVCIFATTLLAYLRQHLGERIDAKQLAILMKSAGADPQKVSARLDERRTTTNVYRLPPALHRRERKRA